MIKILFALLISISQAKEVWTKQGASKSDFANDKQFCSLYAHSLHGRGGLLNRVLGQSLKFDECMEERGWNKQ